MYNSFYTDRKIVQDLGHITTSNSRRNTQFKRKAEKKSSYRDINNSQETIANNTTLVKGTSMFSKNNKKISSFFKEKKGFSYIRNSVSS